MHFVKCVYCQTSLVPIQLPGKSQQFRLKGGLTCDYKERALAVKTSQGITAVKTSCEQDGRLKLQTMSEG